MSGGGAGVLVIGAEVDGRRRSVRTRAGRIVDVDADRVPEPNETVVDARGAALIPGLHDHHIHLRALLAARTSVALDPDSVARAGGFAAALVAVADRPSVRGIGAAGPDFEVLDRWALDSWVPDRPVRIQHRSGAQWLFNSAALAEAGVAAWRADGVERDPVGEPTGRLFRLDDRVRAGGTQAPSDRDWAELSEEALRLGITGFTDATPDRGPGDDADLVHAIEAGNVRQTVTLMGGRGAPSKIILDNIRLPTAAALAARIERAHAGGAPVAIHCVTAEQLVVALAAWSVAGARIGDRVEHAGIVPPGYADQLAELEITVVTQPAFVAARGDDYLRDVEPGEQDWLYPCASLRAAGVTVAGSSDAPFGPLDPWLAMRAAVGRRTASGRVVAPSERIDAATALGMYLGSADRPGVQRRVAAGQPGRLCLLDGPLAGVLAEPDAARVRAVILDDEVITWTL